jgi:hypothetical protein
MGIVSLVLSCSKKDSPAPLDYLPVTAGSQWVYSGEFPQTITVTGNTKVFDGKTYFERETLSDGQSYLGYLYKKDGVYSARSFNAVDKSGAQIEFVLLKDNVPQGAFWMQTVSPQGTDFTYVYRKTIDGKDIAYHVNNVSYANVIVVKNEISIEGSDTPFSTHYSYFALGVGLIKDQKSDFGYSDLDSYVIK